MRSSTSSARSALALSVGAAALAWAALRRPTYALRGRVVLITGGSRGLGLVLARELARKGARLALVARDAHELDRARAELVGRGASVLALTADVRDPESILRAVRETEATYGAVDVLVNNAGVIQVGPFAHMTDADFEESLDVHFWGPLRAIRAVLPGMRRRGIRAHRERRVRRGQDRGAAPRALLRRQVRPRRPLGRAPRRAGAGRHPGDDRRARAHADGLAPEGVVQGRPPPRVPLVRGGRLGPRARGERRARGPRHRARDRARQPVAHHRAAAHGWPSRQRRSHPASPAARRPSPTACCRPRPAPQATRGSAGRTCARRARSSGSRRSAAPPPPRTTRPDARRAARPRATMRA